MKIWTVLWRLHFYVLTTSYLFLFLLKSLSSLRQLNLFLPLEIMTRTNICQHPFNLVVSLLLRYLRGLEKRFLPFPQRKGWPAMGMPLSASVSAAALVVMCNCQGVTVSSEGHLESLPYPPLQSPGWLRERGKEQTAGRLRIASSFLPAWHCIVPDLSAVMRCNVAMKRGNFTVPPNTVWLWSPTTSLLDKMVKNSVLGERLNDTWTAAMTLSGCLGPRAEVWIWGICSACEIESVFFNSIFKLNFLGEGD